MKNSSTESTEIKTKLDKNKEDKIFGTTPNHKLVFSKKQKTKTKKDDGDDKNHNKTNTDEKTKTDKDKKKDGESKKNDTKKEDKP